MSARTHRSLTAGMLCFIATIILATNLQAATVAYWRHEGTPPNELPTGPNTVLDSSGNGNAMQTFSAGTAPNFDASVPWPTVLQSGDTNNSSFNFTPNEDNFTTADKPIHTTDFNAFTIEASFNPDVLNRYHGITGRDGNTSGSFSPMQLKLRDDTDLFQIEIAADDDSIHQVSGTVLGAPAVGTWYNLAAVYDGTNLSLYIDDSSNGVGDYVLQGTTVTTGGVSDVNGGWTVGRGWFGGINDWSDGQIDEVRISDSALAISEFLFTPETQVAPLAHRYSFAGDASDSVGTADLTVNGAASVAGGQLELPGGATRTNNASANGAALTELAGTINGATSMTIESWMTQDQIQAFAKLFMTGHDDGGEPGNTYLDITPVRGGGPSGITINSSAGGENLVTETGIPTGTEFYVAASWNSDINEMRLLIRDASGNTVADWAGGTMGGQSLANVTIDAANAASGFFLGSAVIFGDPDFDGRVNEFRIWESEISQAQSLANLVDGPDQVDTTSTIFINEDWEGNNDAGSFTAYNGVPIPGTTATAIEGFTGLSGGQDFVELVNNDTGSPGNSAIFDGRSLDLNDDAAQFSFSLDAATDLQLLVEFGSPIDNGPTSALAFQVLNDLDQVVENGLSSIVAPGSNGILNTLFSLGPGDYRLELGSQASVQFGGIHIDGVFLRGTPSVPEPSTVVLVLLGLITGILRPRRKR